MKIDWEKDNGPLGTFIRMVEEANEHLAKGEKLLEKASTYLIENLLDEEQKVEAYKKLKSLSQVGKGGE